MGARRDGSDAGFAAVDAVVALTVLATAIGLSLGAVAIARQAALRAAEARAARTELQYLVETASEDAPVRNGAFVGRVEVSVSPADPSSALQLCRRTAFLHGVRGGRDYRLSSLGFCPAKAAT